MKKILCHYPGCNELTDTGSFCKKHIRIKKDMPLFQHASSPNACFYRSYRWIRLRKELLSQSTCCALCGISNTETTLHTHHIVPPRGNEELFFNKDNLTTLCKVCHDKVTRKEIEERREYA
jgi:5-methylcytosine-specific restriction protein A